MEKKIKVLFLSRWYPHRSDSMVGLFVQRHAEAVGKYCDVSVINVQENENRNSKTFEIEQSTMNGIFTVTVYYKKWNSFFLEKLFYIFRYLKAYHIGWKILKKQEFKPDIVHVNILTRTGIISLYLKIFKKIPYIVTEHWSRYLNNSLSYKGFFRKFFTRIIVKNAAAITTVTNNLMSAMKGHRLQNNNYCVIPNVVDTEFFFLKRGENCNVKKRIIHISCFEDVSKNISGIIRSAQKLSLMRQDFEIRLVGDGIDKKMLEDYAQKMQVNNSFVYFDGLMEGQKLVDYINTADFLILFSNYENLPVVILEAFACGLPVLSTNVGGISEYLDKERGMLIEVGNESAFVAGLNQMLTDHLKFNSEKIREYAVNNFSNKVIGKSFYDLYQSVLTGKK